MAAPLPAQTGSSGGEFRLDIEVAEEAIGVLEGALQRLEEIRDDAVMLSKTPVTARDPVSVEAFALLAQKADGGPGSFTAAIDAGRAHLDSLITQMRADVAHQRDLDDAASVGIAGRA